MSWLAVLALITISPIFHFSCSNSVYLFSLSLSRSPSRSLRKCVCVWLFPYTLLPLHLCYYCCRAVCIYTLLYVAKHIFIASIFWLSIFSRREFYSSFFHFYILYLWFTNNLISNCRLKCQFENYALKIIY